MTLSALLALLAVTGFAAGPRPPEPEGAASSVSSSGLPDLRARSEHAAPLDTLARVPGSALRLGWNAERLGPLGAFRQTAEAGRTVTREGEVRWFGSPARARLVFRDDRLVEVELTAAGISPRFASYVPDELRRQGYRRLSHEVAGGTSSSEWIGRGQVGLRLLAGSATMTFTPPPALEPEPPARAVAAESGAPHDSAGIDFTDSTLAAAWPAPRRTFTPPDPVRPRIAADAGVFGRVFVRARVDQEGKVVHAEIVRGIRELDHAALAWASAVRFEPYVREGRTEPFFILIPVTFLPAGRSSATTSSP